MPCSRRRAYLPISPYISPYLPISPVRKAARAWAAREGVAEELLYIWIDYASVDQVSSTSSPPHISRYLPYLPISPLYLPYISPISLLYLSYISQDDLAELTKGVNSLGLFVCSADAFITIEHPEYFSRGWYPPTSP